MEVLDLHSREWKLWSSTAGSGSFGSPRQGVEVLDLHGRDLHGRGVEGLDLHGREWKQAYLAQHRLVAADDSKWLSLSQPWTKHWSPVHSHVDEVASMDCRDTEVTI